MTLMGLLFRASVQGTPVCVLRRERFSWSWTARFPGRCMSVSLRC